MERRIGITKGLQNLDKIQAEVRQEIHNEPLLTDMVRMRVKRPNANKLRQWKEQTGIKYLGQS